MTKGNKRNNVKASEPARGINNALYKVTPQSSAAKGKDIKRQFCLTKNGKCTTKPIVNSQKNKKLVYDSCDDSGDDSCDDSDDDSCDDSCDDSDDDSGDDSDDDSDDESDDESDNDSDDE